MIRKIALLLALLLPSAARAETQAQLQKRILQSMALNDPRNDKFVFDNIAKVKDYATAAERDAATPAEGTIGYALSENTWALMTGSSWVALWSPSSLENGAVIGNAVDGTITITEGGETGTWVVTSNLITLGSTTGATYAITPALACAGDATFNGGDAALTVNGTINSGPWFSVSFNEGAAKGVALYSPLSAVYSTTADAVNILSYGQQHRFAFVTNTTATGTITPAGTALGLDLNAGSPGNSDEWTLTTGMAPGNVGGPIIPGTTAAWAACATFDATDVSEAAGLWLLVTTVGAHADLSSADPNYTSYAGIGIEQTDIVVSDNTDGAVDTTLNASDGVPFVACIRGSSAGVITYYVDGVNTAAAATHTLGDGVPHVVRIQGLNHTGTEAPMQVSAFSLLPQ